MRELDNVNRGGCRTNKHARNGLFFEVMTQKNLLQIYKKMKKLL
jgi:hypothetical protein